MKSIKKLSSMLFLVACLLIGAILAGGTASAATGDQINAITIEGVSLRLNDEPCTEIPSEEFTATVELTNNGEAANVSVMLGCYTKAGQLVDVLFQDASIPAQGVKDCSFTVDNTHGRIQSLKTFVVSAAADESGTASFVPLAQALQVKNVDAGEPLLEGHGLAYFDGYEVAALPLISGDGSDDAPFTYTIASGDYTDNFASFKPVNAGAVIELYQYVIEDEAQGHLAKLNQVTIGNQAAESMYSPYFFVKVTDFDDVVTWYKFIPAGAYEYKIFQAVIVANDYADLYGEKPLDLGVSHVKIVDLRGAKDVILPIYVATDLNDLGELYEIKTTSYDTKNGYYLATIGEEPLTANEVIATSQKAYNDAVKDVNRDTEKFINFDAAADYFEYEVIKAFRTANNFYAVGDMITETEYEAIAKEYDDGTVITFRDGDSSKTLIWRLFKAECLEEIDPILIASEGFIGDYREGYVFKFIDIDGNPRNGYEYAMELRYEGHAGLDNAPNATPRDPDYIDFSKRATTFGPAILGADGPTVDVALATTIDGVTYVTNAEFDTPVTLAKDTNFESEITITFMPAYLNCGNIIGIDPYGMPLYEYLEASKTYTIYYDLLGNSFAAKPAGEGLD